MSNIDKKDVIKRLRCISDWFNDMWKVHTDSYDTYSKAKKAIDDSITLLKEYSYDGWIETNKRPPDDRDWYLGIFQEIDTGWINPTPFICEYVGKVTEFITEEGWIIRDCTDIDNPVDYYKNLKCLAWTTLPKSYYELK